MALGRFDTDVLCDEMEGDEKLGKLERVSLDSRHAT
jgi:hypothetical protein